MAAEVYSVSADTTSGTVDVTLLRREIEANGTLGPIIANLDYILVEGDVLTLEWNPALNAGEQAALTSVVNAHISLTAIEGEQRKVYTASTPPTVNDDIDREVDIGDLWIDTAANKIYGCSDNADGAAVWNLLAPEAGNVTSSTVDPTVNDDTTGGYVVGDTWVNTVTGDAFIVTDVTAGAANWELITNRVMSGQIGQAESLGVTTHNSTTYLEKLSLSATSLAAGQYLLFWSYTWNIDSSSQNFQARIQEDNTTDLLVHVEEATDNTGNYAGTGSDQRYPASGVILTTVGAGNHQWDIDFQAPNATTEVSMWDARLVLYRLS